MNCWPTSAPAGANAGRHTALVIFVLVLFVATPFLPGITPRAGKAPSRAPKTAAPAVAPAPARTARALPAPAQQSAQRAGARIWLAEPNSIASNYVDAGGAASSFSSSAKPPSQDRGSRQQAAAPARILASRQASALTLVSADFNGDGIADLAAGYAAPGGGGIIAVHYGSLDALAPQSDASFRAIGRGEFPAPFLPEARVFSVPAAPDLLAVGNFTERGSNDLVVATRGASVMYVLPADGKGNFRAPQAVNLTGAVTALSGGKLGRTSLSSDLIVGVSGPDGASLLVYRGASQGPQLLASFPLGGPVSSIAFGNLTGGAGSDAAVVANGNLFILGSSSMQLEKVALPISATAVVLGSFVYDREGRTQMAVLSPDGSVNIGVRSGIDSRPMMPAERKAVFLAAARGLPNPVVPAPNPKEGWKVLERFDSAGPGPLPVLLRTRISSNAADDVMVLNGSTGQMVVISHPNLPQGASTFVPGLVATRPYAGSPVAAVSMRVNIDGRPGIVTLHQGESVPSVMMPLPDPVFNVNTTNDVVVANACANNVANSCSLREAIIEANADNLNDTINVPAGTYTLTLTGPSKETTPGATAAYGSLDIFHGLTINGAVDGGGNPTTIVQAGTDNTNGIDKVFAVNPNADPGFDTHFSNLVIQFGKNPGSFNGGPATIIFPHGFGGGLFWEGAQTGNMSVVNCIIANNSTVDGDGGGIAADNSATGAIGSGTGTFTLTSSIVQNNSAQESSTGNPGLGGGIWVTGGTPIVISGSQVLSNQATQTAGGVGGQGGGVFLRSPSNNTTQSAIHGTTISANTAAGHGGGIFTGQGLLIDNAGAAMNISTNQGDQGAGLWSSLTNDTTTLSKVTITGNVATGADGTNCVDSCGGGIFAASSGADTSHLVMHFSRLANNTAASGSNLANLGTANSTDNVINNWWGTNSPAGTIFDASGAVSFDPFIFLRNTPNPANIGVNQSSTLTGDMSADNNGTTGVLAGNLDVLSGVPITFNNPVLGTIAETQPEALSSSGQATATYNAGAVAGTGSADATVDQQTVTANIFIVAGALPPTISKLFLPDTIAQTGLSFLSFSINNPNSDPNPSVTITGVQFTDNLPAGLQVASPNQVTSDCGGTVTATPGSSSISLSGGSIDPAPASLRPVKKSKTPRLTQATPRAQGSCFISVAVTPTTTGVFNNTTGAVSSNESGPGAVSNTATLTVTAGPPVSPPTATKAFGATSIPVNGTTSLNFTITNPNTTTELVNIELDDFLPSGLIVASPNGLTGTCVTNFGAAVNANPGSTSIILSTLNLPGSASCSFSVNVTGITSGLKNNVTSNITGSHDEGVGLTGGSAAASVFVLVGPSIAKAFNPGQIAPNGVSVLSFIITNPSANPVALTGVGFTDTLPANVLVATPGNATGSCNGGTLTAVAGSNTISLTGGTIPANGSCTVSANVTSAVSGTYTNFVTATSTNGGPGNTASANLTVVFPPQITKSFNPTSIATSSGGTAATASALSFTIQNPNTNVALSGIAFTDTLPAGLVVASPNGLTGSCGSGTVTAAAGSGTITLSGGTLPANASCTFSVNVNGTTAGVLTNSVTVTSTEGGPGNTSSASITVVGPPVISKAFGAPSVPLHGSTSLQFTIQNNNTTTTLTGIGFSDTLPAGLIIATPNGLTGNTCNATPTATQGTSVISLSGASLNPGSSCQFTINVTGTTAGTKNNTTGHVTSNEGGTGGTGSASLNVEAPPSIAKAFNPMLIAVNDTSALTLTITNPAVNAQAETGVAVTDTLPAGLVVATPNGLTNTCGGTATATSGTGIVSLTGGTIATASSCTLTVNVTASSSGTFTNTTGAVSSTNGGTGNTATATLTVKPASLDITKKHHGDFERKEDGTYTITVSNDASAGPTLGTVTVTDTLPDVPHTFVPTALSGTGWSCTLATLTCTRSDSLAPGASYPPITLTVNVPKNIRSEVTNTAKVSGGGDPHSHTASDETEIDPPINEDGGGDGGGDKPTNKDLEVAQGGSVSTTFIVESKAAEGMLNFSCSGLPAGVACSFNPPTTDQVETNVTLTIKTPHSSASAARLPLAPGGTTAPLYALAVPLLFIVGAGIGGRNSKKMRLRLALLSAGALLSLALLGCGGGNKTPMVAFSPQQFAVTVTATSATTGHSGSMSVNLTVTGK